MKKLLMRRSVQVTSRSGILPTSGTWRLGVYGADSMDHAMKAQHSLVLTIR